MATGKSPTKFRSWSSTDSEEPGDIHRLYDSETSTKSSSGKCVSTWAFSLIVLSFCVLFLLGLLVGYYVRESQTVDSSAGDHRCKEGERSDRFTNDQVYTAHENVMYFMSALNIKQLYSYLDTDKDQSSGSEWDGGAVEFIQSEFINYGLDNVQVEEYDVVVTYPDPVNPNKLEVVSSQNQLQLNVTFDQLPRSKVNKNKDEEVTRSTVSEKSSIIPYVALTAAGTVEGPLLYGHYGRQVDLLKLNKTGATLAGSILIVRLGQVSVSEKLQVAAEWGTLGVLLYVDPADLNFEVTEEVKVVPYASAGEHQVSGSKIAAIPAQTISMDTARLLLKELQGRLVPASWEGGLHNVYRYGKTDTSQLRVRLIVNNKETKQKVRHVIGTLQGDMETDRYVMIGSSRTSFYRNHNGNMATAHLMELARNMASVRKLEKWGLRRGVKFCSWGGNEFSGIGQSEYLKVNDPIIKMKAVAYIDLDLTVKHNQRSSTPKMEVTANKILSVLVQDVVAQVPDPAYPEVRVSDSWSGVQTYRKHVDPAEYFYGNVNHVFRLKEIGVPVVQPGYVLPTSMTSEDALNDKEHHFKYHLGATRVASLVLLCLVDDRELLVHVQLYTMAITDTVKKSTQLLRQYGKASDIGKLLKRADNLKETGKAFQDYIETMKPTEKALTVRGMNDIVMSLDKAFISPPDLRVYASLLYETTENGQLSVFQNMISRIKAGEEGVEINRAVEALLTALDQCNASLQLS